MKNKAMMMERAELGSFRRMFSGRRERGLLQALLPLALSAGSAYLGSKQKTQTVSPEAMDTRTPERKQIEQFLSNYVTKYGPMYEPGKAYTGDRTAGMTPIENQGIYEFLQKYLNNPDVSGQLGDVRGMLNKTITGGFDPGSSEYYRALREEAGLNNKKAIDATRAATGARGGFFSSDAIRQEGDVNAQTAVGLNKALAELGNNERARSMSAVPAATSIEEYISGIPLEKAKAATSVGSIPRMLEQADLEALYQDFTRRQGELGTVVSGAGSGVGNSKIEQGYALPDLQSPQAGDTNQFLQKLLMNSLPGLLSSFGGK